MFPSLCTNQTFQKKKTYMFLIVIVHAINKNISLFKNSIMNTIAFSKSHIKTVFIYTHVSKLCQRVTLTNFTKN